MRTGVYASLKFFIFTQAGGLFMLLSILGLYFIPRQRNRRPIPLTTRCCSEPTCRRRPPSGSCSASSSPLLVKLPAVPFHPWLPDAHTEAPPRAALSLPACCSRPAPTAFCASCCRSFRRRPRHRAGQCMVIAVIGIIYGAVLSFAQTDLKRLVAYTSVSHMGFVLLGIFAWNTDSHAGRGHADACPRREHRRAVHHRRHDPGTDPYPGHGQMGGFWSIAPRLSGIGPGLRPGLARPSRVRQFHGRIHGAPRDLPGPVLR